MITTGNNNFFFSHKYDKKTIQNISLTQACFFTVLKNFYSINENDKKDFFSFTSLTLKNELSERHKQQMDTYHFENSSSTIRFMEQILFFAGDLNFYHFFKTSRIGRSEVLLNKDTATFEYEFEFGIIGIHIQFKHHKEENNEVIMEIPTSISIEAITKSSSGVLIFNEPVGNRFNIDIENIKNQSLPINVFGQSMIKI